MRLTSTENRVLIFIQRHFKSHGESPTFADIGQAMGWRSSRSAGKYVERLKKKGLLTSGPPHQKRALRLVADHKRGIRTLPLLGIIHAGPLSESFETHDELVDAPDWLIPPGSECAFLEVRGDSMKDKGIQSGDYVLFKKQAVADNHQTVVVDVDGKRTLKEIIFHADHIELKPHNPQLASITVGRLEDIRILGICLSLIRKRI